MEIETSPVICTLNIEQIETIASDVRRARITLSHLADDLIDHICCEVESELVKGKNFEEAYRNIRQQAGIRRLKQIQEDSQFLIDKNYRIMKMTMKITGNVSLAMLGLATVMRLFHWPGANVVLVLGFIVLALVFFPAAIWANHRDTKMRLSRTLHSLIMVGGILLMAGVLFKVMHWPGAGVVIGSGWIVVILLFLPLLLYAKLKEAGNGKQRLMAWSGIGGLMIAEMSTMFKMFHWPGAFVLMIVGAILLISVFLPVYTGAKLKEAGRVTGSVIFVHLIAVYLVILTFLLAVNISTADTAVLFPERENSNEPVPVNTELITGQSDISTPGSLSANY